MLKDYVVIDLEMTGLNAKTDRILEAGAVRVRGGKITEYFSEIINPHIQLPEKITELTGITNEMAESGGAAEDVLNRFLQFLGEDVLVGQNVIFDYGFLKQWAVNHKLALEKKAVDTLKLARKFLPAEQKKDLESLCLYFEVERKNAHRALADVLETQEIFEKLQNAYAQKEPEAFEPKALQYKAKKQSPATGQQRNYLRKFAQFHGIEIEEPAPDVTRGEVSRLTDYLIKQYGKMQKV